MCKLKKQNKPRGVHRMFKDLCRPLAHQKVTELVRESNRRTMSKSRTMLSDNPYLTVEKDCYDGMVSLDWHSRLTKQEKILKFRNRNKNYLSQSAIDKISQQQLAAIAAVRKQFAVNCLDTVPEVAKKFGDSRSQAHCSAGWSTLPEVKEKKEVSLVREAVENIFGTQRKARL